MGVTLEEHPHPPEAKRLQNQLHLSPKLLFQTAVWPSGDWMSLSLYSFHIENYFVTDYDSMISYILVFTLI